jgi:hypothetical protein
MPRFCNIDWNALNACSESDMFQLCSDDANHIYDIGFALSRKIAEGWLLDKRRLVQAVMNGGTLVYWRYLLYDTKTLQARLHLWNNVAETYIHNHRNNFMALGLTGSYVHKTFCVDQLASGKYRAHSRSSDGDMILKGDCNGHIQMASEFTHYPGNVYFLNSSVYHAVVVPGSGTSLPAEPENSTLLTMFVRDKVMNQGTLCLEPLEAIVGLDRVPPPPQEGTENEVQGSLKDRIMLAMQNHLTKFLESQGEAPSDAAFHFKKAFGSWDENAGEVPLAL